MKLIDCFIELFAYVSYLTRASATDHGNYERVKSDISGLITQSGECCRKHHFSPGDMELAQFAVFAWIDETILSSPWSEKQKWQGEQLQRSHFQTVDAGEQFFDRLNNLQPQQLEVREVYYVCLALGFAGRFCNPGDEILLNQLKSANLKLLGGASEAAYQLADKTLFPQAYSDGSSKNQRVTSRFFSIGTILGFGFPVVLFVLLFGIYRFVLSNVGESLIQSIK